MVLGRLLELLRSVEWAFCVCPQWPGVAAWGLVVVVCLVVAVGVVVVLVVQIGWWSHLCRAC